jgi:hypothetical protein
MNALTRQTTRHRGRLFVGLPACCCTPLEIHTTLTTCIDNNTYTGGVHPACVDHPGDAPARLRHPVRHARVDRLRQRPGELTHKTTRGEIGSHTHKTSIDVYRILGLRVHARVDFPHNHPTNQPTDPPLPQKNRQTTHQTNQLTNRLIQTKHPPTPKKQNQADLQTWLRLLAYAVDADVAVLPDDEVSFMVKPRCVTLVLFRRLDAFLFVCVSVSCVSLLGWHGASNSSGRLWRLCVHLCLCLLVW